MNQPPVIVIVKKYGISTSWILTIVFIVAKLWGKIDWSWIMVFIPIWGMFAIAVAVAIALILFVFFLDLYEKWSQR